MALILNLCCCIFVGKKTMIMKRKDQNINLLTDFGFKRFFGTEPYKNNLIHFLNAVLPPYIGQVRDITYLPHRAAGGKRHQQTAGVRRTMRQPSKRPHHCGDAESKPRVLQGQDYRLYLPAHQRGFGGGRPEV